MNTIETIQANLAALIDETPETLDSLKVPELRHICGTIGIRHIDRDGSAVPVYKARKDELIAAILTAVEPIKAQRVIARLPEETLKDLQVTAETVNDETQTDLGDLGVKFYSSYRETLQGMWDSASQSWQPPSVALFDLASVFVANLTTRTGRSGEPLAPSTILNYKRIALDAFETALETDRTQWFYEKSIETYRHFFKGRIDAALAEYGNLKRTKDLARVKERETNMSGVDMTGLLKWADGILSDLNALPKTAWKDVSIALAIVTGRRMAEIHSTAVFEPLSDRSVSFEGQLKAKGNAKDFYSDNPSYPIPVLTDAHYVLDGLQWLSDYDKRIENHKAVNGRYAKDLNLWVSHVAKKHGSFYHPDGSTMTPEEVSEKLSYHKLRELYAICCVETYKPKGVKPHRYIATILGHDRGDSDTSTGSTSQRYEADFYLTADSLATL